MSDELYLYDVFGDESRLGNPAAVVIAQQPWSPQAMQQLATNLGFSETAFVVPSLGGLHLRWFSPTTEVDLCGHATAATAAALGEAGILSQSGSVELVTRSGLLHCGLREGSAWVRLPERAAIEMAVPMWAPHVSRAWTAPGWTILELGDREVLGDWEAAQIKDAGVEGLVLLFVKEAPHTVALRVFAPSLGITEDPVTGSAHCYLAPLVGHLMDGACYQAEQCSQRGGLVEVRRTTQGIEIAGAVTLRGHTVVSRDGAIHDQPTE